MLFWRLRQLHVVLCCRGAIVARSKTRTAYASYNVPRLRNFTSHFRWWGRKSLDRNHKYKASIRTRATSNSGKMVLLWGKKKVALFVMMYCNSLSQENSSTLKYTLLNSLVEIILLILSRQVPHLIGSAPQKVLFSPKNLDFLCQFRYSLEQVCHLGRRKRRGEDWELTKKKYFWQHFQWKTYQAKVGHLEDGSLSVLVDCYDHLKIATLLIQFHRIFVISPCCPSCLPDVGWHQRCQRRCRGQVPQSFQFARSRVSVSKIAK